MQRHPNTGIVITGDLNQLPEGSLCGLYNLKQIVTAPTRGNNTLDKVLTNMKDYYNTPVILPNIGKSDHSTVKVTPSCYRPPTGSKVKVTTRVMGNNEKAFFAQEIQRVNWNPLLRLESCQEQLDYFISTITGLFETHFPKKEVFRHESDKPWVTDSFRKLVRKRQYAYLNGNDSEYKLLRNKVNHMRTKLRSDYFKNKVSELKESNVKQWWKMV